MVQAGGDQQTLQRAVDKQAKVACAADKAAQRIDASLCIRPHKGEQHSHDHHDRNQHDEYETGAAVDLEGVVELGLTEAVVYIGHHNAQQQADEHAHIQHLNAQNHGLAGAGKAALHQHTTHIHKLVHGVKEHSRTLVNRLPTAMRIPAMGRIRTGMNIALENRCNASITLSFMG